MDSLPDLRFAAPGDTTLLDALVHALRRTLADGILPPSRKRVAEWIAAGAVRVDGREARDPALRPPTGARIELSPPEPAPRGGRRRASPDLLSAVRHVDRHLLVVEYGPPDLAAPGPAEVEERLGEVLAAAGVREGRAAPVPTPEARVGGLVSAALSDRAAQNLATAFAEGTARLEVQALVPAGGGGDASGLGTEPAPAGTLRVVMEAASVPDALADLAARGLAVLPASVSGPLSRRRLLAWTTRLSLPHPGTGRPLSWSSEPPPDLRR